MDLLDGITPEIAWGGARGRGLRVAIIDSGIDSSHPDLLGRVTGGVVVTGDRQPRIEPYDGRDRGWHGTACAGIVARLAPEAEIVSVGVLSGDGRGGQGGSPECLLAGIKWALAERIPILNMSLGTKNPAYFRDLHALLNQAWFQNTVVVAAASNDGEASLPSVLAPVVSVGYEHIEDPFRFYRRPDGRILFASPGVYVRVAIPGGGHRQEIGTSFAAPHMSAIVALVLSKHPELKPFEVSTVLHRIALGYARAEGRAT